MIQDAYKSGIIVSRFTSTSNNMGGFVKTWSTYLTISGHIRTLNGQERLGADKVTVYATNRLYCDSADITEKDRIIDGTNTYEIKFINKKLDNTNTVRWLVIDLLQIV